LGTGTSSSRRRIGPDDVLDLVVPKLDPSTLDELAASVRSAHQQLTAARAALRAAYDGTRGYVDRAQDRSCLPQLDPEVVGHAIRHPVAGDTPDDLRGGGERGSGRQRDTQGDGHRLAGSGRGDQQVVT